MSKRSKSRDLAIVPNDQTVPVITEAEWEPEQPVPEPPIDVEFVEAKPDEPAAPPIPPSHKARLMELRAKQREQERVIEDLKAELKEAKALHELTTKQLGKVIDEFDQPDLFDQADPDDTPDDGWQDVPLSEALVNISETVIEALAEARLTTIGELSDWLAEPGKFNRLTDIKGIGEAKAAAIEAALEAFWVRWREAGTAGGGEEDEDES